VRGFRLRQADLSAADRSAIIAQAARYFELASAYARPRGPLVVAICGLMGTGKTSLGRALAPRLDAEVLASDILRKELAGIGAEEPRPEPWGAGIYRDEFTRRTYDEMHRRAVERLREGKVVILDASYREAAWRAGARETAQAGGAPFLLLEAVCPDDIVRQRLTARRGGGGPSDGRLELLETQRERFESPDEIPGDERILIDTSGALDGVVTTALGAVYRRCLTGRAT
jgi:hypothetical protein